MQLQTCVWWIYTMIYRSHKFRVEEKKVIRKLMTTIAVIAVMFIVLVFAGLPMLAKIIVLFSSTNRDNSAGSETTAGSLLFPPSLNPLFEATFTARITVSGYGEKNATVKILVNDKEQAKAQADSEGNFRALNIKLDEGTNNITARNLKDNNISTTSSPLYVIYKNTPPKLDISAPKDGDKFDSNHQNITINGETDSGARVIINDRMAIVDPNGKFIFPVRLNSGDNNFQIKTTDIAGNTVESEITVNFNPD